MQTPSARPQSSAATVHTSSLARTSPTFSDIAKWVCTTWFEGAANPLPIACSTHTPNQISVYGNTEFLSAHCVLQNSRANLDWHSRKKSVTVSNCGAVYYGQLSLACAVKAACAERESKKNYLQQITKGSQHQKPLRKDRCEQVKYTAIFQKAWNQMPGA